jgi:hypothetical protein
VTIREFRRYDRDQLTWLVNLHVSTVLPGVALSTNVVLAQLEREPQETIVGPWVAERRCLVAETDQSIIGAALLLRYSDDETVGDAYRGAAEIRWIIFAPREVEAARRLVTALIDLARQWAPTNLYADGSLPAPGCSAYLTAGLMCAPSSQTPVSGAQPGPSWCLSQPASD